MHVIDPILFSSLHPMIAKAHENFIAIRSEVFEKKWNGQMNGIGEILY